MTETARFDYTYANETSTLLPDLQKRTGQTVDVIQAVVYEAGERPMFLIRFADGYETHAYEDELTQMEGN